MSNPHEPTDLNRQKVIAFSCAGFTQEEIAAYLDIDVKTMCKYYRKEIDEAKYEKIGEISDVAFKLARNGSEKMIEFVLKCRGRWAYFRAPEEDSSQGVVVTLLEMLKQRESNKNAE